MAPLTDPILLILALLDDDDAFELGTDILRALDRLSSGTFARNDSFQLKIRDDKTHNFLFRSFHRGSDGLIHVSDEPLKTSTATVMFKKAAATGGFEMEDLSLYALRRLVTNTLDAADASNDNHNLAIGHGLDSSTMYEYYKSKRLTFDVQGIVALGREKRMAIAARGVRRLTADFRATLTAEQEASINQQPHIAALINGCASSPSSSQSC